MQVPSYPLPAASARLRARVSIRRGVNLNALIRLSSVCRLQRHEAKAAVDNVVSKVVVRIVNDVATVSTHPIPPNLAFVLQHGEAFSRIARVQIDNMAGLGEFAKTAD